MNCRWKLTAINKPDSEPHCLLQSLPHPSDPLWTKHLQCLPTITFNTIYNFLVDRKILLKKVSHIENAMERQEQLSNDEEGSCHDNKSWYESIEYTRTLDKAYRFFKDGHVQAVKYHPWSSQPNVICVTSTILPSMQRQNLLCYHCHQRVYLPCCDCILYLPCRTLRLLQSYHSNALLP